MLAVVFRSVLHEHLSGKRNNSLPLIFVKICQYEVYFPPDVVFVVLGRNLRERLIVFSFYGVIIRVRLNAAVPSGMRADRVKQLICASTNAGLRTRLPCALDNKQYTVETLDSYTNTAIKLTEQLSPNVRFDN
ncbi:hypothetical protein J6590_031688 [Homalodisca vitripennis]|nr:hypothetical protein J6590_031688 [Homalodisca vitripennis]